MREVMNGLHYINTTTADLISDLKKPEVIGKKESQLLFGETFDVTKTEGEYSYGASVLDGYEGYIHQKHLSPAQTKNTHIVCAPSTHIYTGPDFKSRPFMPLSFFSRLHIGKKENGFIEIPNYGWVFEEHIHPLESLPLSADIAEIAQIFLGTPYLYGGRSRFGIDCSGLIQILMMARGHPCPPRDTEEQEGHFGEEITPQDLQRNDIVYFKGHVGIMMDKTHILNATQRKMTTLIENIDDLSKIYDGITALKRLSL